MWIACFVRLPTMVWFLPRSIYKKKRFFFVSEICVGRALFHVRNVYLPRNKRVSSSVGVCTLVAGFAPLGGRPFFWSSKILYRRAGLLFVSDHLTQQESACALLQQSSVPCGRKEKNAVPPVLAERVFFFSPSWSACRYPSIRGGFFISVSCFVFLYITF